jgi:hypothetical protein
LLLDGAAVSVNDFAGASSFWSVIRRHSHSGGSTDKLKADPATLAWAQAQAVVSLSIGFRDHLPSFTRLHSASWAIGHIKFRRNQRRPTCRGPVRRLTCVSSS